MITLVALGVQMEHLLLSELRQIGVFTDLFFAWSVVIKVLGNSKEEISDSSL